MKVSAFDLNHARALHYLLEEAHVARAARRLGITAAAASNALARLRRELDDPLLLRNGRALVRTPLAEELRGPARDVLAAAERLLSARAVFEPRTYDGDFVVAMSDRVAAAILGELDRAIAREAPRAVLRVRPNPIDVLSWLRESDGVAVGPYAAQPGALRVASLFTERFVCVLRRNHPLLTGRWTTRRYAAAEHVLVTPRAESDRGEVDAALDALGITRRIVRVVPTFALALPLLVNTDRIATLPQSFAQTHAAELGLVVRPAPLALPVAEMRLAWHPRQDADLRYLWLRARMHEAVHAAGFGSHP